MKLFLNEISSIINTPVLEDKGDDMFVNFLLKILEKIEHNRIDEENSFIETESGFFYLSLHSKNKKSIDIEVTIFENRIELNLGDYHTPVYEGRKLDGEDILLKKEIANLFTCGLCEEITFVGKKMKGRKYWILKNGEPELIINYPNLLLSLFRSNFVHKGFYEPWTSNS